MELSKTRRDENYLGYLFAYPGIIFILVFMVYPIITCILYSFQNMDLTAVSARGGFAGLKNYLDILHDKVFRISVINSLFFVLSTLVIHQVVGMIIALLVDMDFKGKVFFRGINLLPWAFSSVSVALIWTWIYHPQLGALNDLLMRLGLTKEPITFLSNPDTAILSVLAAHNWRTVPFTFVMLLAGLQNIPRQLYESASIDGASALQQFFFITIPQMGKVILTVAILDFIWNFVYFDLPYVMTGGGPIHSTELMPTYVYKQSFHFYNFGRGASIAVVIFLINMVFTGLYLHFYGRDEHEKR